MIRFTVVTITYNAAPVLQPTLDSVLTQSYANVEHWIIDGKSTDNTVVMAEDYRRQTELQGSSHVVCIQSEPDRGLYDAMNKGLALATGDYIVFLNAGDAFPSADTLLHVADCVKPDEPLPGVLYGFTDIVDSERRFVAHRRLQPPAHLSWRSFCRGMLVCHQAFYARADIAKNNPYDLRYRFSADVDWCIRVMRESRRRRLKLVRVNEVVANYLDGGMTNKNHRASLIERFHIMARHYGLVTTLLMHLWFVVRRR